MELRQAGNANGRHVFIQPANESCFLLVDDLKWPGVEQDHKNRDGWRPARMCVETSPNNFHVWVHADKPLSFEEKKYWLERLGSDPDAGPRGRWGLCPGFCNRKDKYQNVLGRPLSKLIWIDYEMKASIPVVDTAVVVTKGTDSLLLDRQS